MYLFYESCFFCCCFFTNYTVMTVKSKQARVQYLVPCVFTLCVFESYLNIEQWCHRFWRVSLPVFLIIHITLHNCWWSRSCWSLINNKPRVYPGYLQICYSVTMANVDRFHMNLRFSTQELWRPNSGSDLSDFSWSLASAGLELGLRIIIKHLKYLFSVYCCFREKCFKLSCFQSFPRCMAQ